MTFASGTQFHVYLPRGQCLFSVLNVKAVVAVFNQEKGEGPSRGLLRDYEPSDGAFWSTSQCWHSVIGGMGTSITEHFYLTSEEIELQLENSLLLLLMLLLQGSFLFPFKYN